MKSFRLTALLFTLIALLIASVGIRAQDETAEPVATEEMATVEPTAEATGEATAEPTTPGDPFYTGNGSAQVADVVNELDPAGGSGFVRFAHVSPDTGPIDIYLDDVQEPLVSNLQRGEYTGAVRLYSGSHSFTAREAGSPTTGLALAQFEWSLGSNSTWLISAIGRQEDATFFLEPLNVPRNFSQQIARLRLANVDPYLSGLTVRVQDGETLARGFGWLGSYDMDLVVGTDAGTEQGVLNLTVEDVNGNFVSEPISFPVKPFMHYTILLTSNGDRSVVTPVVITSTRDTTRARFVNERQDPIEVLLMPAAILLQEQLEPGTTSEYYILPSEAATFAAYAPGTGPNGQNLAGLPVQLEPGYDLTITFRADGSTAITEEVFTDITP